MNVDAMSADFPIVRIIHIFKVGKKGYSETSGVHSTLLEPKSYIVQTWMDFSTHSPTF